MNSPNCSSALRARMACRATSRLRTSVTSCVRRSSTRIRCQPNGVRTGPDISPILSLAIACSNSGTVSPGLIQPRSPPLLDEPSSELTFAWSANLAPCSMRSRTRSILALASDSDVTSFTRTRTWRACVCSTIVGALRLRESFTLTMWKPPALRSTGETSPLFIVRTAPWNTVGSRAGVRQPSSPPWIASCASEYAAATSLKSRPLLICASASSARRRRASIWSGVAWSGTPTMMCASRYSFSPPACAATVAR